MGTADLSKTAAPPRLVASAMARLHVWTDEAMLDHNPSHDVREVHPERPERLRAALEGVRSLVELGLALEHRPQASSAEQLATAHTPEHVSRLFALAGHTHQLDPDTSLVPGSIWASRLAAGAAAQAAAYVMEHQGLRAWALTRPPGHHATRDTAMGFCLFNNLVVGVREAQRLGAQRVLVVDFDVHAGNGTMDCLRDDPGVLIFDLHQRDHYPHTGRLSDIGPGAARGKRLNLPIPAGSGGEVHREAFTRWLLPIARSYQPELVVIAAGFDAHESDPLGDLKLSTDDFAFMVEQLCALADTHAQGRILLTLEGGYDLVALESCVRACGQVLANPPSLSSPRPALETEPTPGAAHVERFDEPPAEQDLRSANRSARDAANRVTVRETDVAALVRARVLVDQAREVARGCGWAPALDAP